MMAADVAPAGPGFAGLGPIDFGGPKPRVLPRSGPGRRGPSLVVLYDPDTRKYAILDADGVLEENPVFHQFRA